MPTLPPRPLSEDAAMYVIEHAVPDVDEDTPIPFAELSDEAKEIARENFREHHLDYDWWEFCYDDFTTIAELLGITLKIVTLSDT